jgi:hypothetical protein
MLPFYLCAEIANVPSIYAQVQVSKGAWTKPTLPFGNLQCSAKTADTGDGHAVLPPAAGRFTAATGTLRGGNACRPSIEGWSVRPRKTGDRLHYRGIALPRQASRSWLQSQTAIPNPQGRRL